MVRCPSTGAVTITGMAARLEGDDFAVGSAMVRGQDDGQKTGSGTSNNKTDTD